MNSSPSFKRPAIWLLVLIGALIWFGSLDYRHLVKTDEGRYAEIAREMVASGDWMTPRLNGIKYFEKPALQYWATAAAFTAFGEHEWTARLWSALAGFFGIALVWFAGRRLFGPDAGFYAALITGSSLLYALIGHINTLDMGVTFFMTAGMIGFLLAQRSGANDRENRLWMHVAWAALAFSVLSKGLIGLILPGAVLVIYTLAQRDWALWKRLHLATGLALFLAISAPWFVAVSLANPEFFHFFFIHEHFERFLTKAHGRYHPWWYFVPILLAGILPWAGLMFDALARAWKREAGTFQPKRFLLIWAVFIYVFFSVSSSKLPSYILPIFPAFALLMGERLAHLKARALFWQTVPVAVLAGLGFVLAPLVVTFSSEEIPAGLYEKYAVWLAVAAAVWFVGAVIALYFAHKNRIRPAVIALAFSSLVFGQLVLAGHESLAPSNSAYYLAQKIKPYLKPDIPFYSVSMYDQTLPFYIRRTVTLVAHQDELEFGLAQEPQKWLPDFAAFEKAWRSQPYALAIMEPATYQQFKAGGLPMEVIAKDTRRVVVRTP